MALDHGGGIGQEHRDGIATPYSAPGQGRSKVPAAGIKVAIGAPRKAMDDCCLIWMNAGGALQKGKGCQWLKVSRVLVQVRVVNRQGHSGGSNTCPGVWSNR